MPYCRKARSRPCIHNIWNGWLSNANTIPTTVLARTFRDGWDWIYDESEAISPMRSKVCYEAGSGLRRKFLSYPAQGLEGHAQIRSNVFKGDAVGQDLVVQEKRAVFVLGFCQPGD